MEPMPARKTRLKEDRDGRMETQATLRKALGTADHLSLSVNAPKLMV